MKILDTGIASATDNMKIDSCLLADLKVHQEATLHFYGWQSPSATYGYFSDPSQFIKPNTTLDIARRPTGGGIIFHFTDLTFSITIPKNHPYFSINTMENYRWINQKVEKAIEIFLGKKITSLLEQEPAPLNQECCGFCMAKFTKYDVMIKSKKVAGGAHRRSRDGFLHQGSICLMIPEKNFLQDILMTKPSIWNAMEQNSYPLLQDYEDKLSSVNNLKNCLIEAFLSH